MDIETTALPGVLLIKPKVFPDARGFFIESYHAQRYQQAGVNVVFVQDNHSRSTRGVLRGLHFQIAHPQGKLVRAVRGEIWDVAVDIDPKSPTFKTWVGITLDDQQHHQLYVPPGYAHGFVALSETVDVSYKCTDFYTPGDEGGLRWDDPDLAIAWPLDQPLVSDKDQANASLAEYVESLV
ncbi:MAG: dTDP-4-dehydrorhamnose 3,5-epimerase [Proteobacteria bacterium]|nr:dTDP-4-dehydrorhamnose 3,5-epimerase [Pseudomonadota bacterium]